MPLPTSLTHTSLLPSRLAKNATNFPSRDMAAARPTPSKPASRLNLALASGLPAESAFLVAHHVSVATIDSNKTASISPVRLLKSARDARAPRVSLDSSVTGAAATELTGAAADDALTHSAPGGCEALCDTARPGAQSSAMTRAVNAGGVLPSIRRVHCTRWNDSGTSVPASLVASKHTGTMNARSRAIMWLR